MGTFKTPEELKDALAHPERLLSDAEKVFEEFKDFAESLMNNFQIKKDDNRLYWMNDIEFYLFSDNHQDIVTYPRRSKEGMWFFHASGVDITFKSSFPDETAETSKQKPFLAKGAVFGGILIREIVPIDDLKRKIFGPIKVCDELFDQFDAFGKPEHFPEIVPADEKREVKLEKGIVRNGFSTDDEKKVQSILKYNYSGYDEKAFPENKLIERYRHYREEGLYRFKV